MSAVLGIIGGGQLALLQCEAARGLGVQTKVLSPDPAAPARRACDEFVQADYDSAAALKSFTHGCTAVTIDHEHVPLASLRALAARVPTEPSPETLQRLQDRLAQRDFLASLDLPQVPFRAVGNRSAVGAAAGTDCFPGVLKVRTGGYDGYGQVRVPRAEDLQAAWEQLDQQPCVLESWLEDIREFSLVGARARNGDVRIYAPVANQHEQGQLVRSDLPADLPAASLEEATRCWSRIAAALDYTGTLTVEFFLLPDGQVLVNEIAPRVHNSGHVTQLCYRHSQFEMHVRAVTGMELPDPGYLRTGTMLNLYPQHGCDDAETATLWERSVGGEIILYGKEPRPRRKMGHWLLESEQVAAALGKLRANAEAGRPSDTDAA